MTLTAVSRWVCEVMRSYLDVIRPAVLLSLAFDPALDQVQCIFLGGTLTLHFRCCVVSALVQCGAEALRQRVAPRTSQGAELALRTMFGI